MVVENVSDQAENSNLPQSIAANASTAGAGMPAHEMVYQKLRQSILYGELKPGNPVTLQGISDALGVSLTPIRESVRRLISERALEFHGNRRITVPAMTYDKLEEIYTARRSLEGELAYRATFVLQKHNIDELETIDQQLDQAILEGDIVSYLKSNYAFHHQLYKARPSEILLPMVETLWLQLGPSLRVVCGRYGTSGLGDLHKTAIEAMRAHNPETVRAAIEEDIMQGRQIIGKVLLL